MKKFVFVPNPFEWQLGRKVIGPDLLKSLGYGWCFGPIEYQVWWDGPAPKVSDLE